MAFECNNDGCHGKIERRETKGHFFQFGSHGKVKMMENLEVRYCDKCFETYPLVFDHSLDEALERSIPLNVAELKKLIRERHHIIHLRQITNFLGVTIEQFANFQRTDRDVIPPPHFLLLKRMANGGKDFMDSIERETW